MSRPMSSLHHRTYFEQYDEFATACEKPAGKIMEVPPQSQIEMNIRLVDEEWNTETLEALGRYMLSPSLENFAEVADGIADTVYVLMELARTLGVPFDKVWNAVHTANMRKIGPTGKVSKREDGKIIKPPGWQAPDVWKICFDEWTAQREAEGNPFRLRSNPRPLV
jgi:hypothetical protein